MFFVLAVSGVRLSVARTARYFFRHALLCQGPFSSCTPRNQAATRPPHDGTCHRVCGRLPGAGVEHVRVCVVALSTGVSGTAHSTRVLRGLDRRGLLAALGGSLSRTACACAGWCWRRSVQHSSVRGCAWA